MSSICDTKMQELNNYLKKNILNKPKVNDKILKVDEAIDYFSMSFSSVEDIEDFFKVNKISGISYFESLLHIIDSSLNICNIDEEDPKKKEYYIHSINFNDMIFKYVKDIKLYYESYVDFPIVGIEKIKEVTKYSVNENPNTNLAKLLIDEIELKKERNLKKLLNDVNGAKFEIVKNLTYIKKYLIKIKEVKSSYSSMSC